MLPQSQSLTLDGRQLIGETKIAKSGGDTAIWRTYTYEPRRKLETLTDLVSATENRSFDYDDNGRLESASGPWGSGSFSYDAEGNLRGQTLGSRAITVAYDAANRAASANDNGVVKNYAYVDGRGNATTVGANTFTYDFANQPVSVSGAVNEVYAYDANLKRVRTGSGLTAVYSIYSRVSGNIILRDDLAVGEVTEYAP